MTNPQKAETKQFEAEVSQLLQLMINNLYGNKEVFLRELISNASDACDRLRFAALEDEDLYEDDPDLEIYVDWDADAGTLTVKDNGIGMSRSDVSENIGTIAKSGTQEFMQALEEKDEIDSQVIGQFGVGFYSAFIVSERVELETRRAGEPAEQGVRWSSDGRGEYTIETIEREERGTTITLHLREEEQEILDYATLKGIVEKYSDHVSFPIKMPAQDEDEEGWETVNRASALWMRRSSDISDEEYTEFYKHISRDFNDPLEWTHAHIEGRLKFSMLFYIPSERPFDMAAGVDSEHRGVKLYVRRVFIMDDAEMFLPRYLRFVRGVVDSDDLDLNVSRESLQENRVVSAMKKTATNRVLDMLEEMAEEPETYQTFWNQFGNLLKEGAVEDHARRERLSGLLRFATTHTDQPDQTVSLDDYIERMGEEQEKIYYVTADSFASAKSSPHLEIFRDKDIEVLLMYDRIDEWLANHLAEYQDHELQSVAVGDLDIDDVGDEQDDADRDEADEDHADLIAALQASLGQRVEQVRTTRRLRDSPACLVAQEGGMSKHFERMLRDAGQQVPDRKPILEVNPDHPIIERLGEKVEEGEDVGEWADVLFDQAWLSEGGQLDDPGTFVQRMNKLMIRLLGESDSDIITEV